MATSLEQSSSRTPAIFIPTIQFDVVAYTTSFFTQLPPSISSLACYIPILLLPLLSCVSIVITKSYLTAVLLLFAAAK